MRSQNVDNWGSKHCQIRFLTSIFAICGLLLVSACGPSPESPLAAHSPETVKPGKAISAPAMHCESQKAYSCSLRQFSPNLSQDTFPGEPHCIQRSDGADLCATVTVYQFDTSPGIEQCESCSVTSAEKRYQNTEALCVHHGFLRDNIYGIRGQGQSLSEALTKAVENCHQSKDKES